MRFRLVPNSVTLDDLEGRNSPNRRVILPNSVAFGADYVKVVEDMPDRWKAELALGGWLVKYRNKCPAPGIEHADTVTRDPSQY